MKEGSLKAPVRYPYHWEEPDFIDEEKLDAEMRRQFDVCHGCRRCFNLCNSFPQLFDLIDNGATGELDAVDSTDFSKVVDSCTLCDLCFMTKCPYVPPHEFNIDFPHLMARYRHAQREKGQKDFIQDQLIKTDRNGRLLSAVSPLVNWATKEDNTFTRPLLEKIAGIHKQAAIPRFAGTTWVRQDAQEPLPVNSLAPAYGKKVALFATCFCNYNNPDLGRAVQKLLHHNGVETTVVYPGCCGMPSLEKGDFKTIKSAAQRTAPILAEWLEKDYELISVIPSCTLMMKSEWPLICPEDETIQRLSKSTWDISHYLVNIAKTVGLEDGLKPLGKQVTLHMACHARAQNIGQKAAEMLRLIPDLNVTVLERCSGHGGAWGMSVDHFDIALKVGKPVAQRALENRPSLYVSECPLAATHIHQGMQRLDKDATQNLEVSHPIELMVKAFGL